MSDTIQARCDRIEEIEDFLAALDEWGVEDEDERHLRLIEFLQAPIGLAQYIDRVVKPIIGHA